MPNSVVNSAKDETLWEQAKEIAAKEGHKKDWPYIMGIFERSKGKVKEAAKSEKSQHAERKKASRDPNPDEKEKARRAASLKNYLEKYD